MTDSDRCRTYYCVSDRKHWQKGYHGYSRVVGVPGLPTHSIPSASRNGSGWKTRRRRRPRRSGNRTCLSMPVAPLAAPRTWQIREENSRPGDWTRTVLPEAAVPPPSAIDLPAADPLQRPVDPKLLVTSGAKGPSARRQRPAKVDKPTKKVRCVHVL